LDARTLCCIDMVLGKGPADLFRGPAHSLVPLALPLVQEAAIARVVVGSLPVGAIPRKAFAGVIRSFSCVKIVLLEPGPDFATPRYSPKKPSSLPL